MNIARTFLSFWLVLQSISTLASPPTPGSPLPLLNISERGELVLEGDKFSFRPWRSDAASGNVHVIQYFGATMSGSKVFEPFTDLLQTSLKPNSYHVTTILNMDAAMWGTSGFVISELEKNKRVYPMSTMVVDEDGAGVTAWELGKKGTGLVITDAQGAVKYFATKALSDEEKSAALTAVKLLIDP